MEAGPRDPQFAQAFFFFFSIATTCSARPVLNELFSSLLLQFSIHFLRVSCFFFFAWAVYPTQSLQEGSIRVKEDML